MRSARIGRLSPATNPALAGSPQVFPLTRRSAWVRRSVWILTLPGLLLAGCAGGTVNEARLGQARDAEVTPRLDQQQATFTAAEFFPPTPTPTPVPPPPPTVESLVVTLSVGAGDVPQGSFASVPSDAGTVFAGALLNGLQAGQEIEAVWTDMFGNEVGTSRVAVEVDAGQQWVALPLRIGGLPPGDYAVYLFGQDRRLASLVFVVGPPGSGAQQFPPPPDNPQVSVQPTPAPAGNQGDRGRNRDDSGVVDPAAEGQGEPVYDPNTGQIVPATYPPR